MNNGLGIESGFIILFGLTMLYLAATSRIIAHVRILVMQGILLFLICCFGHNENDTLLNFSFLILLCIIPYLKQLKGLLKQHSS